MGNSSRAIHFGVSVIVGCLSLATIASAGGIVNNGGDAVIVDNKIRTFDEVECSDSFSPVDSQDVKIIESYRLVKTQLDVLATKLPHTSKYIASMFSGGRLIWCFADGELKEIKDEGPTSLSMTFDHQQLAVNQDDVVKYRRDLVEKMNTRSFASALSHEAFWSAVGPGFVTSGAPIRNLTNLLMSPSLQHSSAENVGRFISKFIKVDGSNVQSTLYNYVEYDLQHAGGYTYFNLDETLSNRRVDMVITVKMEGNAMNNKKITGLNPNSLYPLVWSTRNNQLYVEQGQETDVPVDDKEKQKNEPCSESKNEKDNTDKDPCAKPKTKKAWTTNLQPIRYQDLCGRMTYANLEGWRLPTIGELQSLMDAEMLQWRYIKRPFAWRVDQQMVVNYSEFLFPSEHALPVITAERSVLEMSRNLRNITDYLTAKPAGVYPSYFCVHD